MSPSDPGHHLPHEFVELVARRFATLSEPMRIRVLDALHQRGEASVGELAEAIGTRHGNASKHLNVLYTEGVVGRRKEGTRLVYRITDATVIELCDIVCGGIRERLRELGELLDAGELAPGGASET